MLLGFKCSDYSRMYFNSHARIHAPKLTTYVEDRSQKANFSNIAAATSVADILVAEAFSNEKVKRKEEITSFLAAFEDGGAKFRYNILRSVSKELSVCRGLPFFYTLEHIRYNITKESETEEPISHASVFFIILFEKLN